MVVIVVIIRLAQGKPTPRKEGSAWAKPSEFQILSLWHTIYANGTSPRRRMVGRGGSRWSSPSPGPSAFLSHSRFFAAEKSSRRYSEDGIYTPPAPTGLHVFAVPGVRVNGFKGATHLPLSGCEVPAWGRQFEGSSVAWIQVSHPHLRMNS